MLHYMLHWSFYLIVMIALMLFQPPQPPAPARLLDLEKVLVPTTTKIINAFPNFENAPQPTRMFHNLPDVTKSPITELASASLDFALVAGESTVKKQSTGPGKTTGTTKAPGAGTQLRSGPTKTPGTPVTATKMKRQSDIVIARPKELLPQELERSNSEPRGNPEVNEEKDLESKR